VQFALIDQAGVRPQLMYERTIASRVELPRASPDALVRGYGEALAEILSQLMPDLGAVGPHDAASLNGLKTMADFVPGHRVADEVLHHP
jgi:hypothetical protein